MKFLAWPIEFYMQYLSRAPMVQRGLQGGNLK